MNTMTPAQVASNRTARLVHEAMSPVYSTDTEMARRVERLRQLNWAETFTFSDDENEPWCHICSRATDHFAEHTNEQLLEFYHGKGRMFRP